MNVAKTTTSVIINNNIKKIIFIDFILIVVFVNIFIKYRFTQIVSINVFRESKPEIRNIFANILNANVDVFLAFLAFLFIRIRNVNNFVM